MANEFVIKKGFHSKADSQVTGALDVSGVLTAGGSVVGSAFPFVGDAEITGSLTISGSFHAFTLDSDNIVLGSGSGVAMEAGANKNVILGTNAGKSLTTGTNNVFIGDEAGYTSTTDAANILIGRKAGYNFTGGTAAAYNICIGDEAGKGGAVSAAKYNIFLGYHSGDALTSGWHNLGMGVQSLLSIAGGSRNIAVGHIAGANISSGDSNINIGYYAGKNHTTGDGNITIGSGSLGIAGESNQLRIGNGNDLVIISASLATGEVIGRFQRPITTHTSNFTSSIDYIGQYNIVGGNLTCSIQTGSLSAGAEFDFFQTSSVGNFLFESASNVSLIVKNGNMNLAGQGSGATLKYISGDTFHMVGDLT